MLKRGRFEQIGMIVACLMLLAGCAANATTAPQARANPPAMLASTTPTASPSPIPATPTPIPATPTAVITTFACPAATTGAQKTFSDTSMRFSFSYPAAWTENDCQRIITSDGGQTLVIGNLFSVSIAPRNAQTIQQWVNAQANQYEIVTLGQLADSHAQEAATVSAAPSATSDPNKPFDAEPFASAIAVVAGSQYFYTVNGFVAQMSMTGTAPNLSRQQLAQQIVSTFVVA